MGALHTLGSLLPQVYPSNSAEFIRQSELCAAWERYLPERVVKNARPIKFEKGVLSIHTTSSIWSNELSYLKDQILTLLKRCPAGHLVRDFRLRVGPLPPLTPRIDPKKPPKASKRACTEISEDLGRALATVRDDDLRTVILEAALSHS